jgi:membrane protein implicated in regulation of membrane protease activity
VAEAAVIGRTGSVVLATRGAAGAGEVAVRIRGGLETYLAWSDDPLPKGAPVLVVGSRGPRTVEVVPWTGSDPTAAR